MVDYIDSIIFGLNTYLEQESTCHVLVKLIYRVSIVPVVPTVGADALSQTATRTY
jgi:hypothetical protein